MPARNFATESGNLVYFAEFPTIFFEEMTGGSVTRQQTVVKPGGPIERDVVVNGPASVSPVTVTKSLDPVADAPLMVTLRAVQLGLAPPLTLIKMRTTANGVPTGDTVTYVDCEVGEYDDGDMRKDSAETSKLVITLQPAQRI